jgi:short chain dehydrogenase
LTCRAATVPISCAPWPTGCNLHADLLVNNAGLGAPGPFVRSPPDTWSEIVHVNVEAVVHLTRLFVGPMIARRAGAVVHVASTAAFEPQPYFAVYAALKAFVLSFGQALWAECCLAGVVVVLRVDGLGRLHAPMSCIRSVLPLATRLRLSARVNRWLYNVAAAATLVSSSDTVQSRSAVAASRLAGEEGTGAPSEK